MHDYKSLKSASKVSVRKQDVNGIEELQVVKKMYSPDTGAAQDDRVTSYELPVLASQIARCKSEVTAIQAKQSELEQLETDLKAL